MHLAGEEKKNEDERAVWEFMLPKAWHNSVSGKGSVFHDTYAATRREIEQVTLHGQHDVIIEVGCGTGDIIGELKSNVPQYGLDINRDFVDYCRENHKGDHCTFEVQDATTLVDWWNKKNCDGKYKKPLVTCVNNTLNIMPEDIRGSVVAQMLAVAGENGRCLVTYWNGNFFSHAIMNYYKKNQDLCGPFELKDVDWKNRTLVAPSGYSTEWHVVSEVQQILRAFDVDVDNVSSEVEELADETDQDQNSKVLCEDRIHCAGLAIFVWFSRKCTCKAKGYYDSPDAQKFYNDIWGKDTIHIGRYDKLNALEKAAMPKQRQIAKAQEIQERDFCDLIRSKFNEKVRILDMGCGYGGLLRRLYQDNLVWSATGVDIAVKMCEQAKRRNAEIGCQDIITIKEESYLDVSIPDESVDLVISMDALLHVGPERQKRAIAEAARVLRPGGWMIFTDIMQQEDVDAKEMQPIYDRIHLEKLGTISNYKEAMENVGFRKFGFEDASCNVSLHYGTVLEVLNEKGVHLVMSSVSHT